MRQGDVVAFPRGKEGAHQIRNDTDAPVRVLMLSTLIAPDIVEYLDTGKIGARSIAGERIIFARPGPELEYGRTRTSGVLRVELSKGGRRAVEVCWHGAGILGVAPLDDDGRRG